LGELERVLTRRGGVGRAGEGAHATERGWESWRGCSRDGEELGELERVLTRRGGVGRAGEGAHATGRSWERRVQRGGGTGSYTYATKVWDLSIVQGPFSVVPKP
jgi:hypothetical protein